MPKKKLVISILLKPSDFSGNEFTNPNNCPLARAFKRHMGMFGSVDPLYIDTKFREKGNRRFKILNGGFDQHDYQDVKDEYAKGSKRKWDHYVEIREVAPPRLNS